MKIRKRHSKKVHRHEKKSLSLLQSDYNRVMISYIISYILKAHSTSNSAKKKKGQEKEAKDKGERQNEGKEKEGKEKERKEMKNWRRRKREKRKEERKKREEERKKRGGRRRIKHRESSARDAPPSPGAFPSRKLGNNMTPIKGRLGKNTTPTGRDPEKLIQKLQRNPNKDNRASNVHPMRTS